MTIPVNIVVRNYLKDGLFEITQLILIFMGKAHSDSQKTIHDNNKDAKIVELYPSIH